MTLVAGGLALAVRTLDFGPLEPGAWAGMLGGILAVGACNLGVSFALAFGTALRARRIPAARGLALLGKTTLSILRSPAQPARGSPGRTFLTTEKALSMKQTPRVVILGGGFAGLYAARALRNTAVAVTLVDRKNHHLFQPMLYQVAHRGPEPRGHRGPHPKHPLDSGKLPRAPRRGQGGSTLELRWSRPMPSPSLSTT